MTSLKHGDCISKLSSTPDEADGNCLRVIAFNIERGLKRKAICQWLKRKSQNMDVMLLSEVDVGCTRTGNADVCELIRDTMGDEWSSVYGVEFEELNFKGVHGNAIITRHPIVRYGCVQHSVHYDWESYGWLSGQARRGRRCFVWADIAVDGDKTRRFYSCHFENLTGIIGRITQYSEVLNHALIDVQTRVHVDDVVIGGDLNTLMHGVLRFMPLVYPGDALRFDSAALLKSEATFWQQYITSVSGCNRNAPWRKYVLDGVADALIAGAALQDPFDKERDTTVNNFIWSAKLDWLLFSNNNYEVMNKEVCAQGMSDHDCVYVELKKRE